MESRICFICQRNPIAGRVARYDIEVCRDCWENNWNSSGADMARVRRTLSGEGLPVPVRNVFGLFPRA